MVGRLLAPLVSPLVGRLLGRLLGPMVGVLTDQLIVVYGTVITPTIGNSCWAKAHFILR